MKTKVYIAKVDLPGGIKKGDLVIWLKAKVPVDFDFKNIKLISFDPSTEPNFFTESILPKYSINDTVFIKAIKNRGGLDSDTPVRINNFRQVRNTIEYTVECKGRRISVKEEDLYQIDSYWFVNSKGAVCSLPLTEEHKQSITYRIRCYHNNAFLSKEEAQAHLNAILIQ